MSREQGICLASVRMTFVADPAEWKGAIFNLPNDDEDAYIRERIRDAGALTKRLKESARLTEFKKSTRLTRKEIAEFIAAARNEPDENGRFD